MTGIAQLLQTQAENQGGALALIGGDRRWSYADLAEAVACRAGALRAQGLRPGAVLAVQGANREGLVVELLAAAWAGLCPLALHPGWTGAQREALLARAAAVAWSGEGPPPEGVPATDAASGAAEAPAAPAGSLWLSSGSTGPPKLVLHRSISLARCAQAIAQDLALDPSDRSLGLLPLSFHYGYSQLSALIAAGGACVLHRSPLPASILDQLEAAGCTVLAVVPGMLGPLLDVQEQAPRDLGRLRRVTSAGGRPDRAQLARLGALLPQARRVLYYGQTEVLRSSGLQVDTGLPPTGTLGRPFPGVQLVVVDPAGQALPPGQSGELVHGGAGLPERVDARAPRPCPALGGAPGWWTGDRAHQEMDGELIFEGRTDDVVKIGGFRVGPGLVEDCLLAAPGVPEAVVVAVGDATGDLRLVAAVQGSGAGDGAALRRWCRARLLGYMVPSRVVEWRGAWPVQANGKRDRRAIAAALGLPRGPPLEHP